MFPSLTADRNFAYSLAGGQVQRSSSPPTSRTCRMYAEIGKAAGVDYTWENCRERAKVELRCSEGGERRIDEGNEDQPRFNIVADPTQEENQGKSRAWLRRERDGFSAALQVCRIPSWDSSLFRKMSQVSGVSPHKLLQTDTGRAGSGRSSCFQNSKEDYRPASSFPRHLI
ncbi:uncharacterized protein B0T23DRAFT_382508 [Neurospora hispaniola]|uniref:Uncharacterized protein n=1 Tax=Neurospora hispaniola TaxID=588809 RepID=A0AAJ0I5W6_9PEZI|nr:hypothetical protein B0T23DRAFT_382508 [Neurospora hispaniola]